MPLKFSLRNGATRLNVYLFRQLLIAFLLASSAVTFVILFTQSFRLLALVIDNASTMWFFFQLLALSIPTFLPIVLPLGLGVAVLFVYHKLAIDSELVVMRAAGISPLRQAKPAFLLGAVVMIFAYVLTLWATPAANRHLVALQYQVRDNISILFSRPGNFNDVTDGVTFYTRARGTGGALEGILMHDVRKPQTPITVMAESGQVVDKDGQPQLIVFNGKRQEMNTTTGQLSQLSFDQYVLDFEALRTEGYNRLADPREQTVGQLLNPSPEMAAQIPREKLYAELNGRFASPLLAFSYTLIGLAAILAGEFNRRGMGRRILIAAAAIISVQASYMSINSMTAKAEWMTVFLYLAPLVPILVGFLLINIERFKRRTPASAGAPAS